jgi:hypothetical protein
VLTYRQERALQAFGGFARVFPIEQAIASPRNSVRGLPEADWDDPELAERMADIAAELHAIGELADTAKQPRTS